MENKSVIDIGEQKKPKAIKEISIDTQLIVDHLAKKNVGDFIPYSEFNKLIGRDVQGAARHCLESARRILQRDERIVFATIKNEGIKRLDDVSIVNTGRDGLNRIRREAKRTAKRVSCAEYDKLPNDKKIEHNLVASMTGALSHMTKAASIKKLESRVQEASDRLAIGTTLEAMKG